VAKFIVPDWGDKVDSDIGLFYRPGSLHRLPGRYGHPYVKVNFIPPVRDYEFGYRSNIDGEINRFLFKIPPNGEAKDTKCNFRPSPFDN
jgi:hypothetical protein